MLRFLCKITCYRQNSSSFPPIFRFCKGLCKLLILTVYVYQIRLDQIYTTKCAKVRKLVYIQYFKYEPFYISIFSVVLILLFLVFLIKPQIQNNDYNPSGLSRSQTKITPAMFSFQPPKQRRYLNAQRPSSWQRHISVPQQLENTHYSQVTLIHSGPAVRGPALTYCSLYYQHQECYNSFPQWPRY